MSIINSFSKVSSDIMMPNRDGRDLKTKKYITCFAYFNYILYLWHENQLKLI